MHGAKGGLTSLKMNKQVFFLFDGKPDHFYRLQGDEYFSHNRSLIGLKGLRQWHLDAVWFRPILLFWMLWISFKHQSLMAIGTSRTKNINTVYWLDTMGVFGVIMSLLFQDNRPILILNIMLTDSGSLMSNLKTALIRRILAKSNVYYTLNNSSLFDYYKLPLSSMNRCFELGDIIHLDGKKSIKRTKGDNSIICLGSSGRDIDLLILLALKAPELRFIWITKSPDLLKCEPPENLCVKVALSVNEVNSHLSRAKVVILPLTTQSPAGILSVYHSINNGCPVLITRTVTTESYFIENSEFLVENNTVDEWMKKINLVDSYCSSFLEKEFSFIMAKSSQRHYWERLNKILDEI